MEFCEACVRYRKGGTYWYTAKVEGLDKSGVATSVATIPQSATIFAAGQYYCNDMHLQNAIRHKIRVPDGTFLIVGSDTGKGIRRR